jgi:hypothetical protein
VRAHERGARFSLLTRARALGNPVHTDTETPSGKRKVQAPAAEGGAFACVRVRVLLGLVPRSPAC